MLPQPLDLGKPVLFCEEVQVGVTLCEIGPQRYWPPEAHACVAVAMPSSPHSQPQSLEKPRAEHQRIEGELRSQARTRFRRAGEYAILQHAVIVEADRHEHDIAYARGIEPGHHIAEQSQLGWPELAIAREPPLGKYRLRHARSGRDLHIARQ